MKTLLFVPAPSQMPINEREILRYAGVPEATDRTLLLLKECVELAEPCLSYKACFCSFPLTELCEGALDLGFAKVTSSALARRLKGCDRIVAFAATVGLEIDRLIARYETLSPSKALLLDAIGSERIEALCALFEKTLSQSEAQKGRSIRARFSPGYGDLPLTLQEPLFAALECKKTIGLCLGESMLMSPSKSVTAILGICPGDLRE